MIDEAMNDWLLAQIEDDERVAREAAEFAPPPWYWGYGGPQGKYGLLTGLLPSWKTAGAVVYSDSIEREHAAHIARWDPARVLAECKAKRRIVERYQRAVAAVESDRRRVLVGGYPHPHAAMLDDRDVSTLLPVVQLLAQPYADREGFRDEWAVS